MNPQARLCWWFTLQLPGNLTPLIGHAHAVKFTTKSIEDDSGRDVGLEFGHAL